jgi:predicted SprT family Zn-dependent metalloprotease
MSITEAESLTLLLLKKHLPKDYHNWKVEFVYNRRILGSCDSGNKIIRIALHALDEIPSEDMEDTCRHEVAHAVADTLFHSKGHDSKWKNVCTYMLNCSTDEVYKRKKEENTTTHSKSSSCFPLSNELKDEIENTLRQKSLFFLGQKNLYFLTVAYEEYRTNFNWSRIKSIIQFEKVLYYYLLKKTGATNVTELNEILEKPYVYLISKVHEMYKLIISNEKVREDYRREAYRVINKC